jgi:hypothetical protein
VTCVWLRLAPAATAPHIAHPPLPSAWRRSGRVVRNLRFAVALGGLLHLFVDLPQGHPAWALQFVGIGSSIAIGIVFHESRLFVVRRLDLDTDAAGFCLRPVRQISALSGCSRHEWRGYVLNLLASALRTSRMSGLMFSKMLGMFEHLTALLAPVLVSRHGIPPTRILHVVLAGHGLRRRQ